MVLPYLLTAPRRSADVCGACALQNLWTKLLVRGDRQNGALILMCYIGVQFPKFPMVTGSKKRTLKRHSQSKACYPAVAR